MPVEINSKQQEDQIEIITKRLRRVVEINKNTLVELTRIEQDKTLSDDEKVHRLVQLKEKREKELGDII